MIMLAVVNKSYQTIFGKREGWTRILKTTLVLTSLDKKKSPVKMKSSDGGKHVLVRTAT